MFNSPAPPHMRIANSQLAVLQVRIAILKDEVLPIVKLLRAAERAYKEDRQP